MFTQACSYKKTGRVLPTLGLSFDKYIMFLLEALDKLSTWHCLQHKQAVQAVSVLCCLQKQVRDSSITTLAQNDQPHAIIPPASLVLWSSTVFKVLPPLSLCKLSEIPLQASHENAIIWSAAVVHSLSSHYKPGINNSKQTKWQRNHLSTAPCSWKSCYKPVRA